MSGGATAVALAPALACGWLLDLAVADAAQGLAVLRWWRRPRRSRTGASVRRTGWLRERLVEPRCLERWWVRRRFRASSAGAVVEDAEAGDGLREPSGLRVARRRRRVRPAPAPALVRVPAPPRGCWAGLERRLRSRLAG